MSDAHLGPRHSGQKFYRYEYDHHPFRIQSNWREKESHPGVGEEHRIGYQKAVDRAGGPQHRGPVQLREADLGRRRAGGDIMACLKIFHAGVQGHCSESGDEIEDDENIHRR